MQKEKLRLHSRLEENNVIFEMSATADNVSSNIIAVCITSFATGIQ